MQDIHLIGSGRIFTGGGGGGSDDHRLRHNHQQLQALKCPRCDSLNTKFCYYNNYNLSQPRHFCKSCRRYWTKGGVLRNVPVGGGCRKSSSSKRSSTKPTKETKPKSNSNSSSESSNLSGTKASKKTKAVAAVTVDLSAAPSTSAATPASADAASNVVFGFSDTEYIFPPVSNPNYSSELMNITDSSGGGFTDIGKFTNMVTSSSNIATSCDVVSPFHMNLLQNDPRQQQQFGSQQMEHWQLREVADAAGVYVDPTVQTDKINNNGSEPLNWQQQEQQMFGMASAVDQGYWSEQMFGLLD